MTEYVHQVTLDQSEPLADILAESRGPEGWALPVSIDGRGFLVDLSTDVNHVDRMQRRSINLLNTQQAQSEGDLAQTPPEVWRRSVESWNSGAGQDRYDRSTGLPARFADSRCINVWDPWRFSLLHDTTKIQALAAGRSFLTTVGPDWLYAGTGTSGYWWQDVADAPTTCTHAATVVDVCTDGQALYVLDSTGNVERWTNPTTHASFATITGPTANRMLLRYLKGFLVVANGNVLLDITSGTPATIYTHPLSGFTFVDACEGLAYGYLLGGMGDRWHVLKIAVKSDGTTLDPPVVAGPVAEGEIGASVASYLGYLLVGTSLGWRFGAVDSDGSVNLGRLVETPATVHCFEGQGPYVWYGLSSGSRDSQVAEVSGLGRSDLSAPFTATMTPAYASDLATASTGTVRAVTTFGVSTLSKGKRVFTIDGDGVYAESDDLAPEGWLRQGMMTFGTSDPKMGMYAQVYHEALAGGRVQVQAKFDDADWVSLAINDYSGTVSMGNIPIERAFNLIDLKLVLTRDALSPNLGPVITRSEVRALPIPGQATEWTIPLVIAESIDYDNIAAGRDVISDQEFLLNLVRTRKKFAYREGDRTWNLYATDFQWVPLRMTLNGSTFQGTFLLVAREMR